MTERQRKLAAAKAKRAAMLSKLKSQQVAPLRFAIAERSLMGPVDAGAILGPELGANRSKQKG